MAYQIVPPNSYGKPDAVRQTLVDLRGPLGNVEREIDERRSTEDERSNPSFLPTAILNHFHFIFLIRHPSCSVPSYYRTTIPPLLEITKFAGFDPDETGYRELRALFDYLRSVGQVGPGIAGRPGAESSSGTSICLLDADDLLDKPAAAIEQICKSVGLTFDPAMLSWDSKADEVQAGKLFADWKGWHDDAIASKGLKPRDAVKIHTWTFRAQRIG